MKTLSKCCSLNLESRRFFLPDFNSLDFPGSDYESGGSDEEEESEEEVGEDGVVRRVKRRKKKRGEISLCNVLPVVDSGFFRS